jgi:hypothetical protein
MPLEEPIDFKAAARYYLGCSERHLFRLCEQYSFPRRYRFNGAHRTRIRVVWKSEVAALQPIIFRATRKVPHAKASITSTP